MHRRSLVCALSLALVSTTLAAQQPDSVRLNRFKQELAREIDSRARFTQQLVDQIFSFQELGFQEVETSRFLTTLLRDSGFTVQDGIFGIPTAWVASWGNGRPVISLGTDIDGIPGASQWPGIACHSPMMEGGPGHGEGHNSGMAVNITAALATRAIMRRERMSGTIRLWPGVAEELVGTKAYYVREGLFRDVDLVLFSHVSSNLSVAYGDQSGTGLVSVEYTFEGRSAHAAGAPWRGRSALDAVELMDIGWNFRREHLRTTQRSHDVITNGGFQPNVVPSKASVWYYFRETDEEHIRENWAIGDTIAQAAAMMTGTRISQERLLGSAWPQHFNRVIAETMSRNIQRVGLPTWTAQDQQMAKALQREIGVPDSGLAVRLDSLRQPLRRDQIQGGGSDDIGDVSWNVPTVTLRFPSNIPGLPGHNWTDAIAMATPIAHKGATAGAKAMAMTILDFVMTPALVDSSWSYFRNVQTRDRHYTPFIRPTDQPAVDLNASLIERFRPRMSRYYYDPSRYGTYLEQLGITYPTVRRPDGTCPSPASQP